MGIGWWMDRNRIKLDLQRIRYEYSVGQKNYPRRIHAVKQLGHIGGKQSIPALLYAMGDPDFTVCDAASKSLTLITGVFFRQPLTLDPTREYQLHSEMERIELREIFQAEREAWIDWLLHAHPDLNPEFDPYEKVAGNIDAPTLWMGLKFE